MPGTPRLVSVPPPVGRKVKETRHCFQVISGLLPFVKSFVKFLSKCTQMCILNLRLLVYCFALLCAALRCSFLERLAGPLLKTEFHLHERKNR